MGLQFSPSAQDQKRNFQVEDLISMEPRIRQLVDSSEIIELLQNLNNLKIEKANSESEKEQLKLKYLTDQTKLMENHFGVSR